MGVVRCLTAGVAGGLAVMIVAFGLHRPPLDDFGWSALSSERAVQSVLAATAQSVSGIYSFGIVDAAAASNPQQRGDDQAARPSGLILYLRPGEGVDPARAILQELIKTLAVAILASIILARLTTGLNYAARTFVILAISTTGSISTHISYNAWFGFPVAYTLGRIFLDVTPWLAASLIIAAIVTGHSTADRRIPRDSGATPTADWAGTKSR